MSPDNHLHSFPPLADITLFITPLQPEFHSPPSTNYVNESASVKITKLFWDPFKAGELELGNGVLTL